jgi:hypothetical protein
MCTLWESRVLCEVSKPLWARCVRPQAYRTGASKWNPIEHRLFSEISKNWPA